VGLWYGTWTVRAGVRGRARPRRREVDPPQPQRWPKLSVVVPACDEGDRIEAAARTLMATDYPDVEIVLVDDRSTDDTGEIIDRIASEDERVRAVHVTELPEGWLGKVHALDRGVGECSGEYVLFTDADVHFTPPAFRKMIAYCVDEGLDHVAGFPSLWPTNLLLDSAIAVFIRQFMLVTRPWDVADADSQRVMGIGAMNLVRREAFDATQGFEWLRLEVADDFGLGMMMKRSGAKSAVVTAGEQVSLQWYRTLGEAARGAEKGYATAANFSLPRTFAMAGILLLLELSPLLCLLPLLHPELRWIGCAGAATTLTFVGCAALWARWGKQPVLPGLVAPLTAPILAALTIRAGLLGRRRGGVCWRGTLYTTDTLRAGKRVDFP
jgi:hypothetical protein